MPRIRTVKPEFWDDEVVGGLTFGARLLFVCTWNLADDEGLLRWTEDYLNASAFMYDGLTPRKVRSWMDELATAGRVFPYSGGRANQRLGWIVNFRRHQRINRPQPGKLPPPPLHNATVRDTYGVRDRWTCHLCGGRINPVPAGTCDGQTGLTADEFVVDNDLLIDRRVPQVHGGTDYPSNVNASHLRCAKARGDMPLPEWFAARGMTDSPPDSSTDSLNDSVNDSVSDHGAFTGGRERKGKEGRTAAATRRRPRGPLELPGDIARLKSKLDVRKLEVRWDKLTLAELDEVSALIAAQGDERLVSAAIGAFRTDDPPVFAQAWLKHWRALAAPGELRAVARRCPVHFLDEPCRSCAADAKAARP